MHCRDGCTQKTSSTIVTSGTRNPLTRTHAPSARDADTASTVPLPAQAINAMTNNNSNDKSSSVIVNTFGESPEFLGGEDPSGRDGVVADDAVIRIVRET